MRLPDSSCVVSFVFLVRDSNFDCHCFQENVYGSLRDEARRVVLFSIMLDLCNASSPIVLFSHLDVDSFLAFALGILSLLCYTYLSIHISVYIEGQGFAAR